MDFSKLPRVTEQVRLRWAESWWSGPLWGICSYKGEDHFFSYDMPEDKYALYRLDASQLAVHLKHRETTVDKYGEIYTFGPDGNRVANRPPKISPEKYRMDKSKSEEVRPSYPDSQLIAWFNDEDCFVVS